MSEDHMVTFLRLYETKCSHFEEKPISNVVEVLENCIANESANSCLELCGREKPAEKKLRDVDVTILCETMREGCPFDLLNFSFNHVTDRCMKSVGGLIETATELTGLNLMGNDITETGTKILAASLKNNTTLQTLSLKGNKIGDEGATALAEVLGSTKIQSLDLGDCDISTQGFTAICVSLREHPTLSDLSLSNSRLQGYEFRHLCSLLLDTPSLQRLNLSRLGSALNDDNCLLFAEYLQNNDTLTHLDLSQNSIGAEGVFALRQVLCAGGGDGGCTLEHLDLSFNRLSEHSCDDLGAIIRRSQLRSLYLRGCSLFDQGLTILAKAAAEKSDTLLEIQLERNQFGSGCQAAWRETMGNSTLEIDFAANIAKEANSYDLPPGKGLVADQYC